MADIDIKQPAKINRNTAADGDFLWEKDFKVLYDNDEKLKNAIQQATQDYTAGDGIYIDPSTKTISVKTGTGIEKTEEGLSVNIEGKNIDVQYNDNKFTLSAFDSENAFNELSQYAEAIDDELDDVKRNYTPKPENMVSGVQYVYSTDGWKAQEGGSQTIQYWRPGVDDAGNISWQLSDSTNTPQTQNIKGPEGDKGDKGDDGVSPTVALSPIEDETKTGTEIVITDKNGAHTYSAWNGINGINGKSVELSVDDSNAHLQWCQEGGSWHDTGYAVSGQVGPRGPQGETGPQGATGPKGETGAAGQNGRDGLSYTISVYDQAASGTHLQGGLRLAIQQEGGSLNNYYIWNGNNGTAVIQAEGYVTGNGTSQNPVKLISEAVDAIEAVSGKVSPASYNEQDDYFVWKYSNQQGAPSGWTSLQVAGTNEGWITSDELDLFLKPKNGLSGKWVGENIQEYQFGLSAEYEDAIKNVANKVDRTGDTMTGQLVVNTTTNHPFVGISQRGDSDDFAVFGATRKKENNNFGTTWLGVGSNGQGVLKNIPNTSTSASTEPESNGAYTQITFYQNNNAVPSIDINAKRNGSDHNYKSVVVPQQSYNNMSAFDATNGPNYMLRKLNDGSFDIGACVINVTSIPETTEANTYYFVYDIV